MVKEKTPKNAPPWMDGVWTCHFISLGSSSIANLPIVKRFRGEGHPSRWLENKNMVVHGCGVTLVDEN